MRSKEKTTKRSKNLDRAPLPSMAEQAVAQTRSFSGCRILVAEDNPVDQQLVVRMLKKLGCRVDVAANGLHAVAMHHVQAYDLLLMDCQMPELDGYQATALIRAMQITSRRVPIVALTAFAPQGGREKCLAAGMDDFIAKPIRAQILKEMLGRWLQTAARPDLDAPEKNEKTSDDELEAVHEIFGDDFSELAALYQTDSPKRIAILGEAIAAGKRSQVAKVAHAFGGSCASIGATRLSALCRDLELHARGIAPDGFETRLAAIEAEYQRVSAKLDSLVGSHSDSLRVKCQS